MIVITNEVISELKSGQLWDTIVHNTGDKPNVTIIHSSDWHFSFPVGSSLKSSKDKISEVFKRLNAHYEYAGGVSGFISTGDHVDSKELKTPQSFATTFSKAGKVLDLESHFNKAQIILVPGNHDSRRNDPAPTKRLDEYREFASKYVSSDCPFTDDMTLPVATILEGKDGVTVIIGFNSAIIESSVMPDYGHIHENTFDVVEDFLNVIKNHFRDRIIFLVGCLHHHLASTRTKEEIKIVSDATVNDLLANYAKNVNNLLTNHTNKTGSASPTDGSLPEAPPDIVKPFRDDILKKIPITSTMPNSRFIVERLGGMGFQLLVHGHQHKTAAYDIGYYDLTGFKPLTTIHCCSITSMYDDKEEKYNQIGCIEIDYTCGKFSYVKYDMETGLHRKCWRDFYIQPINNIHPGDRRLLKYIENKFVDEIPIDSVYQHRWRAIWEKHLIIPTSPLTEKGEKGFFELNEQRRSYEREYDLFLFLRENNNKLEILMNHHASMEEPLYSDWRSFLLPSFRPGDVLDCIKHLRWDLLRKLREWAPASGRADLEKQVRFLINEELELSSINSQGKVIRVLAEREFERVSPTWGGKWIMKYKLVQANYLNQEKFRKVFNHLPSLDEFEDYWSSRPKNELCRGFVWVPFNYWKDDLRTLYSNGDVMRWVEESAITKNEAVFNKDDLGSGVTLVGGFTKVPTFVDDIIKVKVFKKNTLFNKLKTVKLKAEKVLDSGPTHLDVYRNAKFLIYTIPPEIWEAPHLFTVGSIEGIPSATGLWPAQTYVSMAGERRVEELRQKVLLTSKNKVDIFCLDGYCSVEFPHSVYIDVLPPIVELSEEDNLGNIWLINDGIHRIYYAKKHNIPINVVLVWDVPEKYYAYPTTWESVSEESGKPPYTKKHREDNFRDYYRNFGEPTFRIGHQGGI